jgi:hypothetical protein
MSVCVWQPTLALIPQLTIPYRMRCLPIDSRPQKPTASHSHPCNQKGLLGIAPGTSHRVHEALAHRLGDKGGDGRHQLRTIETGRVGVWGVGCGLAAGFWG